MGSRSQLVRSTWKCLFTRQSPDTKIAIPTNPGRRQKFRPVLGGSLPTDKRADTDRSSDRCGARRARLFLVNIDGAQAGFGFANTWKAAPQFPGHFLDGGGVAVQRAGRTDERRALFGEFDKTIDVLVRPFASNRASHKCVVLQSRWRMEMTSDVSGGGTQRIDLCRIVTTRIAGRKFAVGKLADGHRWLGRIEVTPMWTSRQIPMAVGPLASFAKAGRCPQPRVALLVRSRAPPPVVNISTACRTNRGAAFKSRGMHPTSIDFGSLCHLPDRHAQDRQVSVVPAEDGRKSTAPTMGHSTTLPLVP